METSRYDSMRRAHAIMHFNLPIPFKSSQSKLEISINLLPPLLTNLKPIMPLLTLPRHTLYQPPFQHSRLLGTKLVNRRKVERQAMERADPLVIDQILEDKACL